ncbi:MAG: phosphoglycerate kinase [Candidatus Sungbacteria bacterium RIFCSPLOWO2_02_FULL_47_9]|uniref:Phosphoglycerate kinase n=1 Tax=Candidatus Sungbacteria bacterium RIFCSPHIGHO2_01_FULL_47_32 TaxID=1802264 RepID=A0A1G2K6P4_9BACT|nr:MAG: phosphoglycerate kinase [Candidatus Sungbacteria bacterium RIFCSPHIGHO2_01_FULL_47_32]OHA05306.1 MAG: phosphoglycerate kinase [Candidatus Sungbacteria bacterium RIFCSPLOWO2_01_FULL_47_32]OHA10795.1 MAG: phosphoglycerate kinase [Candidatus Sungbacteria bacterium RIFCSPLOWO2_02_FULL_47_9]
MRLRSVREAHIQKGMSVLLRVDFNVPMKGTAITDDFRIQGSLETVRFLLKKGARIVIISHLGRPTSRDPNLSLRPVFFRFKKLLHSSNRVIFVKNPFDLAGICAIQQLKAGEIAMVENIRFWKEEERNNLAFARKLSCFGRIVVNDAFGDSHREHASIAGIAKFLPAYAGFLLVREVRFLERAIKNPKRPVASIIGGAKISTKYELIRTFLSSSDQVLVGGALANSLLVLEGISVGKSVFEKVEPKKLGPKILTSAKLHIPVDGVVSKKFDLGKNVKVSIRAVGSIGDDEYILDIGPETEKLFINILKKAKTIIWNGPVGYAEVKQFSHGTLALARAIGRVKAFRIIGGGDTIAILKSYNLLSSFDHVSTGGGAMLEFLAGDRMPGIEVVMKK